MKYGLMRKLFFYIILFLMLSNIFACGEAKYNKMSGKIEEINDNLLTIVNDNNNKIIVKVGSSIELEDEKGNTLMLTEDILEKKVIIYYTGMVCETSPLKIKGIEKLVVIE